ncbi:MAG TPA: zf-TFIIB domain-containing protein [Gemmatimonadaceae bacterium]|nr:zf-TFIIB domain-containing protein [Gemmatimonadaceae bacterium]
MAIDEKPSRNEDEYFARQNADLIKEMRARLDAERKTEKKQTLKCPRDGSDLEETEADNVKVDTCPRCKGVWLDAGELDQLRLVNRGRGVTGGVLGSLFRRG